MENGDMAPKRGRTERAFPRSFLRREPDGAGSLFSTCDFRVIESVLDLLERSEGWTWVSSNNPQSRVVLESHSDSLLAQFDRQVEIIADRYLAFFKERRRVEETYIKSLRKLHRKAKTADASLDPRAESITTRAAWGIVRDNLEREANTQQDFVRILDSDVIKPLAALKESMDVTRRQIEEDLKRSAATYADHAENRISKLQQAYLKKHHPQQYARSTSDVSQRPQDFPKKRFGGKVSALFRTSGRGEDLRERRESQPAESDEVSDDECRRAVGRLNILRSKRAETLRDGYDCLEELVFTPTVKDILVRYMDGMITACAHYDKLAMNTRAEVKKALAGTDTSDLRGSFRRALSFAIPPPTLYRNCRPGAYSNLIFGVPLVDLETNEGNVPKVIRMCIEEVEKRGLDTKNIYSDPVYNDAEVLQLRHRFESEKSFSFSSTDTIRSIATLLKLYLWDLPEPLLMLSLHDYRNYRQNRASHTENDFLLLRSKIHELHPVLRKSLGALLGHLFHVASHSDDNEMTVEKLAEWFQYAVLRGDVVLQDGIQTKKLVVEDLIQNVHTLFEEHPSPLPLVPSSHLAETMSVFTDGLAVGIPTSAQFPHSPTPLNADVESRVAPSPTALLSPLLGFPSSGTLAEGVGTTTQAQAATEVEGTKEVGTSANSYPAEVVSDLPTSVTEWRSRQSQLSPHPEPSMIPQSPPESSTSDFRKSSATSLQTGMGRATSAT